ncbi:MAG TPA: nucleoside monophosphate kinase [Candidatus Saccharimonadales bacterium]|nr:nucleoside monophosphate kinase [Candidatus Saccharimonadales bacterium]
MQTGITKDQLKTISDWLGAGSVNLFGLPFAGKDTHGTILAETFNATLLGGGDILRNSVIPAEAKAIMHAGGLIPTEDYLRIVLPYLSRHEFAGKPLILSSVGRWSGEEEGVLAATEASHHPIRAVVYLQLNEDTVKHRYRISQTKGDRFGRTDDAEHLLDTRIKEFNEKTIPVIEAYRRKGLLIEVNSEAAEDEVTDSIFARLLVLATNSKN